MPHSLHKQNLSSGSAMMETPLPPQTLNLVQDSASIEDCLRVENTCCCWHWLRYECCSKTTMISTFNEAHLAFLRWRNKAQPRIQGS